MSSPSPPFISVILPVFNDTERLARCLECLAAQSYPRDQFEVIVVDNGSEKSPQETVQQYDFCSFAQELTPGSYAARNHGLKLARGEVLAFTDSDCLPEPEWLAAGVAYLAEHPEFAWVGGHIEVFPDDPERPSAVELFDMIFGLDQHAYVHDLNFAATANLLVRGEVLEQVGAFDATLKSGGDGEWGQRATSQGFAGAYCAAAIVRHPARRELGDLVRQARRHAGGRIDRGRRRGYRYASLHFWRTAVRNALPNVHRIRRARIRLAERGYGMGSWMKVSGVILLVQYARLGEFVRKWLGGASERR